MSSNARLNALGMPTGKDSRVSRSPSSALVGASCFLFVLTAAHAAWHGDAITCLLAVLQTSLSFVADYIANMEPPALSSRIVRGVCACDRGAATALSLWLVALSVYMVSEWMALAVLPLAPVLAWSRASPSRSVWIWRHSAWHAFAVLLATGVLETVYSSRRYSETASAAGLWAVPTMAQAANQLTSALGWQLQLAALPLTLGGIVAAHGLVDRSSSKTDALHGGRFVW